MRDKKNRRVGADVGGRGTDEEGAERTHDRREGGEGGWCVYPSRRGWRRTCARISRVRPTHIDPTPANSLVPAGGGRRGVPGGGPGKGGSSAYNTGPGVRVSE